VPVVVPGPPVTLPAGLLALFADDGFAPTPIPPQRVCWLELAVDGLLVEGLVVKEFVVEGLVVEGLAVPAAAPVPVELAAPPAAPPAPAANVIVLAPARNNAAATAIPILRRMIFSTILINDNASPRPPFGAREYRNGPRFQWREHIQGQTG
jgi:hypothetical protein